MFTIARATIADASILILDESTSFVIDHRLSTIKKCRPCLVIKDGNIIEQGTHDQLIERNGFYAEL